MGKTHKKVLSVIHMASSLTSNRVLFTNEPGFYWLHYYQSSGLHYLHCCSSWTLWFLFFETGSQDKVFRMALNLPLSRRWPNSLKSSFFRLPSAEIVGMHHHIQQPSAFSEPLWNHLKDKSPLCLSPVPSPNPVPHLLSCLMEWQVVPLQSLSQLLGFLYCGTHFPSLEVTWRMFMN